MMKGYAFYWMIITQLFQRKIHLYWCGTKYNKENYGDLIGAFLAERISGREVIRVQHPRGGRWYKWIKKHYVTVGSIISVISHRSVVWGSGIISENEYVPKGVFLAVRGPLTRKRLLQLGYQVPEIYGDPAVLLPLFIINKVNKKYKIGIIPHYVDYERVYNTYCDNNDVKVINLLTDDVVVTTREILQCSKVISSSLHGVIVSHAYNIPALWVKFSNKIAGDNIKFYDYFESVKINYQGEFRFNVTKTTLEDFEMVLKKNNSILMPSSTNIIKIQEGLLASCPYNYTAKWKVSNID